MSFSSSPKSSGPDSLDLLSDLITTFNELNGDTIEELNEEPSPLEFMRYVARNTPFVIRGGASMWPATRSWTPQTLIELLHGQTVNVAVTPKGNADSPSLGPDGQLAFVKPWEEDQPFDEFLRYVIQQETSSDLPIDSEVRYAQTQNDNLRHEYVTLFSQVQQTIPFARIALQREPEAINLWIGNSRSVTAMHRDNFDNIYVQLLGRKYFVLMPSLCHPCVNEIPLRPATYAREAGSLVMKYDEEGDWVPFATWDPDNPSMNATPYSHLATPVRVTLNPGDMLYLPTMWYHKVSQSCLDEGICVAVNYWFDMDFTGPLYPLSNLVRQANQVLRRG